MSSLQNSVVILTACDHAFFPLCVDLISSLRSACGAAPRLRVLDVGMRPQQAAEMRQLVEAVIAPDWDLGAGGGYPGWFRAMTARPCLPRYAGDAEIVVWIDSDAWVQSWTPLGTLIAAAADGRLAIVEERFGPGWTIEVPSGGKSELHRIGTDTIQKNVRQCYETCFGPQIATALGDLPSFNSGVFALRSDSPVWALWKEKLAQGLAGAFHKLVEQQALNILIRQGQIPVALQPLQANFVCGHDLPWFSRESGLLTLPRDPGTPIGVVHLTDAKHYPFVPVPVFPDGRTLAMPLIHRLFKIFLERNLRWSAAASPVAGPV